MNAPRTWSSAETAAFLGISEKALRERRYRGTSPPFVRMGKSIRYVPRDVALWIEDNTHTRTRSTPSSVPLVVS